MCEVRGVKGCGEKSKCLFEGEVRVIEELNVGGWEGEGLGLMGS